MEQVEQAGENKRNGEEEKNMSIKEIWYVDKNSLKLSST